MKRLYLLDAASLLLLEANKRDEGAKADVGKEGNMAAIPARDDVHEGSGDWNKYPYVDPQIVHALMLRMLLVNIGKHQVS